MRAFGALLLVAACALFGISRARALGFHRRCVEDALCALRTLSSELSAAGTPTPEIFAVLAARKASPLAPVFAALSGAATENEGGLAERWARCWLCDRRVSLSREERRALARLGDVLGRYPGEEQVRSVDGCVAFFEEAARQSEKSAREGMKLSASVGVCFGLMLAAALL